MTIKWEAYDIHDRFCFFEVACLWLEIEPSPSVWLNIPRDVDSLMFRMEQVFEGCTIESGERAWRLFKGFESHISINPEAVNCDRHIYLDREAYKRDLLLRARLKLDRHVYIDPEVYKRNFLLVTRQQLIEFAKEINQRPKFLFSQERNASGAAPDPKDNEPESIPLPRRRYDPRYAEYRQIVEELLVYAAQCHPEDRNSVGKLSEIAVQKGKSIHKDTIRRHLKDIFGMD